LPLFFIRKLYIILKLRFFISKLGSIISRTIIFAPYFPHHNKIMVCGNTSKASDCEPVGPDKLKARSDIDQEKLLMVQGMVSPGAE